MSHKLFAHHTYKGLLPPPFDICDTMGMKTRTDVKSVHNKAEPFKSMMHPPTLTAYLETIRSIHAEGDEVPQSVAVGMSGKYLVAERLGMDGKIEAVAFHTQDRKFIAGVFSDEESTNPEPYVLKEGARDGTALMLALVGMHKFSEFGVFGDAMTLNEEFDSVDAMLISQLHIKSSPLDHALLSTQGCRLSDNLYTRICSSETLGGDGLLVRMPTAGNIQPFAPLKIKRGGFAPDCVLCGTFRILKQAGKTNKPKQAVLKRELPGKYALSERHFSPQEQALIPEIEPWYVVPQEVLTVARHAQATTSANQPMRNFMLRGAAGVGKTEGARAIASALNLPYMSLTCSANTEVFDLLGQILPDVEGIDGEGTATAPILLSTQPSTSLSSESSTSLPTLQDIQMDPSTAYSKLTGQYVDGVSEADVYGKLLEVMRSEARKEAAHHASVHANHALVAHDTQTPSPSSGQKFRYIETPLVKAMKYGYLIEIQEPSVIANPGVLVGLNSLLDNCKQITLPTGETITRHPDTVVVVTTNNSYSGCRDINQSVISRMNIVMDIDEPTTEELVSRVSAVTGCKDTDALISMAGVVKDIQVHCERTMITDGCCGVRELMSWVQSYQIVGSMSESAKYTILSSVSASAENREEVWNVCIAPKVE